MGGRICYGLIFSFRLTSSTVSHRLSSTLTLSWALSREGWGCIGGCFRPFGGGGALPGPCPSPSCAFLGQLFGLSLAFGGDPLAGLFYQIGLVGGTFY